jgi:hypothetical protein
MRGFPLPMKNLPTAFQRNALWTAVTALSITSIGALAIGLIYLMTQVIAFLQPILVPFAVAGVLAYLQEFAEECRQDWEDLSSSEVHGLKRVLPDMEHREFSSL